MRDVCISHQSVEIRLDLQQTANQVSCCKGKWYVRRLDPNTVQNSNMYSSIKEEEVFIYSLHTAAEPAIRAAVKN